MGLRLRNGSTILVNMSLKNLSDAYELTIPGFGNARVDGFYVQKNSGQTMQKARSWKLCLLDDGPRNAGMFGSICFGAGRGTFLQMSQPHQGFWVLWNVDIEQWDLERAVSRIRTCLINPSTF